MAVSLEDRFAIHDLFVRYTTALDSGDVETIVSCFAADGVLESPAVGKYAGRDRIREFSERFAAMNARGVQLRHVISNLAIEGDGDSLRATCYLINIMTMNRESQMMPPGRYECAVRKIDGAWLFQHRLVILDAPFRLPEV